MADNTSYFDPSQNPGEQFTSNPSWNLAGQSQRMTSAIDIYTQQFQNLLGRAPTQDEINTYANNVVYPAWNQEGNLATYGDQSGLASAYIQNNFGPQAAQYQQQQQTNQLGTDQNLIQGMINQTMGNTETALANPQSSVYQGLAGQQNNAGADPTSGAFQAGAGSTVANAGLNAANSALQSIAIPGVQSIGNLTSQPYSQSLSSGSSALSNLESQANWGNEFSQQSALAQELAAMGQSSSAQNILGMASGAAQGAGDLLSGSAELKTASKTWICTALRRHHLLTEYQVNRLHDHLYRAFPNRPFKFLGYLLFGKLVVLLANWLHVDWTDWRDCFYDQVISENDPVKAVDLYEKSFWALVREVKHRFRIKTLFIYDNPDGESR